MYVMYKKQMRGSSHIMLTISPAYVPIMSIHVSLKITFIFADMNGYINLVHYIQYVHVVNIDTIEPKLSL